MTIIRRVNNRLKDYGKTDWGSNGKAKAITINKKMSKEWGRGGILNTIVHEELHAKHPKMHEKTIYKKVPKVIEKMSARTKKKLYSKYS